MSGDCTQNSHTQINLETSETRSRKKAGGLGLGLPITHQLVAAHGGVLRITSPGLGQGCTALIRLPVIQAVTNADLKEPFTLQYTAMGYNLDQLLNPALASAEARACPVFSQINDQAGGNASGLARASSSTSSMIPAGANLSRMSSMERSTRNNNTVSAAAQGKQAGAALFAPMNLPAHLIPGTRGNTSTMSCASSMDLSSNVFRNHTYKWPPGSTSGNAVAGQQGGALPAHGGVYKDPAGGEGVARPSEDSLAQWEEYAERMGYTVPSGMSFEEARATGQYGVHNLMLDSMPSGGMPSISSLYGSESMASAAASAQGLPGAAVALMSSLYSTDPAPAAGGGVKRSGSGKHRAVDALIRTTPIRDSIDEVDDECAEPEDVDLGNTVKGSGNADKISGNAQPGPGGSGSGSSACAAQNTGVTTPHARTGSLGRNSDVSNKSGDVPATEALMSAAAHATQARHGNDACCCAALVEMQVPVHV